MQPIISLDMWEVSQGFSFPFFQEKREIAFILCYPDSINYSHFFGVLQHAYYLDYKARKLLVLSFLSLLDILLMILRHVLVQNDRGKYVNTFMNHLVSWSAAMERMARAEAFVNLGEPKIPIA